jgi:hypothetical protein
MQNLSVILSSQFCARIKIPAIIRIEQTTERIFIFSLKNTGSRNEVNRGNVEKVIVPMATVDNWID